MTHEWFYCRFSACRQRRLRNATVPGTLRFPTWPGCSLVTTTAPRAFCCLWETLDVASGRPTGRGWFPTDSTDVNSGADSGRPNGKWKEKAFVLFGITVWQFRFFNEHLQLHPSTSCTFHRDERKKQDSIVGIDQFPHPFGQTERNSLQACSHKSHSAQSGSITTSQNFFLSPFARIRS